MQSQQLELSSEKELSAKAQQEKEVLSAQLETQRTELASTARTHKAAEARVLGLVSELKARQVELAAEAARSKAAQEEKAALAAKIAEQQAQLEKKQAELEHEKKELHRRTRELEQRRAADDQKEYLLERAWENDKVDDLRARVRELKAAQRARQEEYNATLTKANEEKAAHLAQIRTLVGKLNEKHVQLKALPTGSQAEGQAAQEASDEKAHEVTRLKEAEKAHEASLKRFEMLKELTGKAAKQHEEQLAGLSRQIEDLESAQAQKEREFNATLAERDESAAPLEGNLSVAKLARTHAENQAKRLKEHMAAKNKMLHKMREELNEKDKALSAKEASLARAEFDLSKNEQALKEGARVLAEGELRLAENEQKFIDMRDEQRHLVPDGPLGRAQARPHPHPHPEPHPQPHPIPHPIP